MLRRRFLQAAAAATLGPAVRAAAPAAPRVLLRSSWQTVNIGDIAHTPGMLALLEKHRPDVEVTLWPTRVDEGVDAMLRARFPRLAIAAKPDEQRSALGSCDFVLHGSGPSLVAAKDLARARAAGKPFGVGGITLADRDIEAHRDLLSDARFLFLRDTDSLRAVEAAGIGSPRIAFGPDATFAIDLRDEAKADAVLAEHRLESGRFLVVVPRLRWTPYWEIHPGRVQPDAERIRVNEEFAERDHAKLRAAIVAWVRRTGMRVLLAPEMTYAVPLLRPLLLDPLPADVKPHVASLDRYWLTAEACSVYARSAALVSMEQHSPIMAIASGVPAVLVRQPTDTRKGRMWYDLGMTDWVFEVDDASGDQIADRVVELGTDQPAARAAARRAKARADERMAEMMAAIP